MRIKSLRKNSINRKPFIFAFLFLLIISGTLHADTRHRIVVLTDISRLGDSAKHNDDIQSLVRLLVYSNEFDIEGLVATMSWSGQQSNTAIYPQTIHRGIDAYAKVYPNLIKHDSRYPTPSYLKSIVKAGRDSNKAFWGGDHMQAVGNGKSTAASRHIVNVLKKNDNRPVWFLGWGKLIDLAQAVFDINTNESATVRNKLFEKIKVYDIAGQCNGGAYLAKNFKNIYIMRSVRQFLGITNGTNGSSKWLNANIRNGHGPLGSFFPSYESSKGVVEGDSPSLLWLMPNGISNPMDRTIGNWGGKFGSGKSKNPVKHSGVSQSESRYKDYFMYKESGSESEIRKWSLYFQNDFAARMDWCVKSYGNANHNPIINVNGNTGNDYYRLNAKAGSKVILDAGSTKDPDGNQMSFNWSLQGPNTVGSVTLNKSGARVTVNLPANVSNGKVVHVLLKVTDNGSPALSMWKRTVITINSNVEPPPPPPPTPEPTPTPVPEPTPEPEPATDNKVTGLKGVRTALKVIQLSWDAPKDEIKEFRIVLGAHDRVWERVKIVSGTTLSTTLDSSNNITENIALLQIRAIRNDGLVFNMSDQLTVGVYQGPVTPEPTPTPVPEPAADNKVTGLKGVRTALKVIQLSWDAPKDEIKEFRIVLGAHDRVWKRVKTVSGTTLSTTLDSSNNITENIALLQIRAIRIDNSEFDMSDQLTVGVYQGPVTPEPTPTPVPEPTPEPEPAADNKVTGLKGVRTAPKVIQLSWNAPKDEIKEFRIVLGAHDRVWERVKTVSGTTLSTTLDSSNNITEFKALLQIRAIRIDNSEFDMSDQLTVGPYQGPVIYPPPPEPNPDPGTGTIKIMPLGDSITHAIDQHDSYRYTLWNKLKNAGYKNIDFVGSQTKPKFGNYLHPSGWDMNHEGHGGWRADEIEAKISGWANVHKPDIVLLHIGTNDMFRGQSVSSTIAEIGRIIDKLRAVNPKVTVFLAKILPVARDYHNKKMIALNKAIPGLVSSKNSSRSKVILVDQNSGIDPAKHMYDGIHPNTLGEKLMAEKWFTALKNHF